MKLIAFKLKEREEKKYVININYLCGFWQEFYPLGKIAIFEKSDGH